MTNGNDSIQAIVEHIDGQTMQLSCTNGGLTKRELFAAMAMQGLCLQGAFDKGIQRQCEAAKSTTSKVLAVYAVDLADELIKALNDTP